MNEKDFAVLMTKVEQGITEKVNAVIDPEAIQELTSAVEKQGMELKKNMVSTSTNPAANFQYHLVKEMDKVKLKDLRKGETKTISTKVITGGSMGNATIPYRETGPIDKASRLMPFVQDLIQWGTTTGPVVQWLEQATKTDGSATRAEGAAMGEGGATYDAKSVDVKIISEYMKATNEALRDYDYLAGEIQTELTYDLDILLSNQLLSGDGTGTNVKGILEYAVAFDAGIYALNVQAANKLDVLRIAVNNIIVAGNGKFIPNYIVMHPSDVTDTNLIKDSTDNYILPMWVSDSGTRITGVPIVQNTGMTIDNYLVGDFTRAKAFDRDPLAIDMGWENDDFTKNQFTIRGNRRLAFRIKDYEAAAFVTGDFTTDVTAITKA